MLTDQIVKDAAEIAKRFDASAYAGDPKFAVWYAKVRAVDGNGNEVDVPYGNRRFHCLFVALDDARDANGVLYDIWSPARIVSTDAITLVKVQEV